MTIDIKQGDYKHSMKTEAYLRYGILFFFGLQVLLTIANLFNVRTDLKSENAD